MATLLAIPAMWLIGSANVALLTAGILLAGFGPTMMFGPQATFFAEMFGTRVRYSGASLGFPLGAVLAGGLSPLIAASLATAAGNLNGVAVFMVGLGVISTLCVLNTQAARLVRSDR